MRLTLLLLGFAPACAMAAVQANAPQGLTAPVNSTVIAPIDTRVIAPIDLHARVTVPLACLTVPGGNDGIIGEEGSQEVIGEKVIGEKIIGEKGSEEVIGEKIIGEKGSEEVIGEKSAGTDADSVSFGHRWNASGPISYKHVIAAPAGQLHVAYYACSGAAGGQRIQVRVGDTLQQSLLATSAGANGSALVTLPKPPPGQRYARLPVEILVEGAGTGPASGVYKVTVTR